MHSLSCKRDKPLHTFPLLETGACSLICETISMHALDPEHSRKAPHAHKRKCARPRALLCCTARDGWTNGPTQTISLNRHRCQKNFHKPSSMLVYTDREQIPMMCCRRTLCHVHLALFGASSSAYTCKRHTSRTVCVSYVQSNKIDAARS